MRIGGEDVQFSQSCDSVTDPLVRRGLRNPGTFVRLAQAWASTFGSQRVRRRDVRAADSRGVPDRRALPRLLDAALAAAARVPRSRRAFPTWAPEVHAIAVETFSAESDDAWSRLAPAYRCAARRDAAFLNWRFRDHWERPYRMAVARGGAGGPLRGHVVYRDGMFAGRRMGLIADWFVDPDDDGAARSLLALGDRARVRRPGRREVAFVCPTTSVWFARFQEWGFEVDRSPYVARRASLRSAGPARLAPRALVLHARGLRHRMSGFQVRPATADDLDAIAAGFARACGKPAGGRRGEGPVGARHESGGWSGVVAVDARASDRRRTSASRTSRCCVEGAAARVRPRLRVVGRPAPADGRSPHRVRRDRRRLPRARSRARRSTRPTASSTDADWWTLRRMRDFAPVRTELLLEREPTPHRAERTTVEIDRDRRPRSTGWRRALSVAPCFARRDAATLAFRLGGPFDGDQAWLARRERAARPGSSCCRDAGRASRRARLRRARRRRGLGARPLRRRDRRRGTT